MNSFSLTARIIVALCFVVLLMFASLIPGQARLVAKTPVTVHKLLHVCCYAVLVLLLAWVLEGIQPAVYRLLAAWLTAVSFGAVMEWRQTRVPGRYGTLNDVALNAAGAALGVLAAFFWL